ncbi:hypothetical protein F8M41_008424 [Gigaspora margarita]|uniref:Restriction endonuclease domain-containing protein n=1 Tax=Gigaspora margarita TaxID=4874 RepID=A0A8H3X495_GIGMA|nr:hypothetical protein F8M41_008424 [Gigaspora margarita]
MEATDKEKIWWVEGTYPSINGERLPLIIVRDVSFKVFAKKSENAKAGRFWDYDNGIVTIIELPSGDHEGAAMEFNRQIFDQFRNVASPDNIRVGERKVGPDVLVFDVSYYTELNYVECRGNPWPTIVLEVASFETLEHIKDKINNFWLGPNRCEDCLKFCRRTTLQLDQSATTFDPIQEIEFGTVGVNGRASSCCSAPQTKWLTIDRDCIYAGCAAPLPPLQVLSQTSVPRVAIDLYEIQQAIFDAMDKN